MARTTVIERIRLFIKSQNMPVSRFEKLCGFGNNYIAKLKASPSEEKLKQIFEQFPDLRKEYILYDEEPMLKSQEKENAKHYSPYEIVNVPLVNQYAYGGYMSGYADPEYVSTLPTVPFVADRQMTGNYVAFEIHGDSMNDGTKEGYVPGEVVICREVEQHLWQNDKLHINKRDFVIVHKEGILIKRITDHNVAQHRITIHSLNPEYTDKILDLADVKQIFSVVSSQIQRGR